MGDLTLEDVNRANTGTELQGEANPSSDFKAPFILKVGPYVGDLNDHLVQRDVDAITGVGNRHGNGVVGIGGLAGGAGQPEGGNGVVGKSNAANGVLGIGVTGVFGEGSWDGVNGHSTNSLASGVYGHNESGGYGVYGRSVTGTGILGVSESTAQVKAGTGVVGRTNADNNSGVYGENTGGGFGVTGESSYCAVYGKSSGAGFAVMGEASEKGYGVYASSNGGLAFWATSQDHPQPAGVFQGNVQVEGDMHVTGKLTKGTLAFKIDHPLDPARKYLSHSGVESPDMKNIYDGIAVLDDHGEAIVQLPAWFEALNTDFRYQLTCVGAYAQVYIAEKIHENCFKIAGGKPAMEVCWQVTGIRQDAWAMAHRITIEEDKSSEEHGYYLHPELYGEPEEKHVHRVRHPELTHPIKSMAKPGRSSNS